MMIPERATLEAEADRLAALARRIGAIARRHGIAWEAAGSMAVRGGLADQDDWDLLALILDAIGGSRPYHA